MDMDTVEEFFSMFPHPDADRNRTDQAITPQIRKAIEWLPKQPESEDPDFPYLVESALRAFELNKDYPMVAVFRQSLARLSHSKGAALPEDGSYKTLQLKYSRWQSQGAKDHTYPFKTFYGPNPVGFEDLSRLPAHATRPTSCASCGKFNAELLCHDCHFTTAGRTVTGTAYCTSRCRQKDRVRHRAICGERKTMFRAVSILSMLFRRMVEATWTPAVGHMGVMNGITRMVFLDTRKQDAMTGQPLFRRFPGHLAASDETYSASLCNEMQFVRVYVRNAHRPTLREVEYSRNNMFGCHMVIKAIMPSEETFVVDLTAPQYGWRESLAQWEPYERYRTRGQSYVADIPKTPDIPEYPDIPDISYHNDPCTRTSMQAAAMWVSIIVKGIRDYRSMSHPQLQWVDEILALPQAQFEEAWATIKGIEGDVSGQVANMAANDPSLRLYCDEDGAPNVAFDRAPLLENVWMSPEEYQELMAAGGEERVFDECFGQVETFKAIIDTDWLWLVQVILAQEVKIFRFTIVDVVQNPQPSKKTQKRPNKKKNKSHENKNQENISTAAGPSSEMGSTHNTAGREQTDDTQRPLEQPP
ncbi:hypothetical protein GGR56DRAFT_694656 [Xylariaceae sp. FL0804]|nr:hypothetical protein GGR56DRAFT_694656 [Xylariaceae sp. FL0804]